MMVLLWFQTPFQSLLSFCVFCSLLWWAFYGFEPVLMFPTFGGNNLLVFFVFSHDGHLVFSTPASLFPTLGCDVLVVILNPLLLSITNGHDGHLVILNIFLFCVCSSWSWSSSSHFEPLFSTQDWSWWSSCDLEPLRPSSSIFATFCHDALIIILNPLLLLFIPNHGIHLVILNPLILSNFNFWSWSCSSYDFELILPLCFQFMVMMHLLWFHTSSSSLFLAPSCDVLFAIFKPPLGCDGPLVILNPF
jgi:hypothetical protein